MEGEWDELSGDEVQGSSEVERGLVVVGLSGAFGRIRYDTDLALAALAYLI